ncbi:hypothetical protein [Acetobacter senegalensis]|uniref:hypothetical protein n=1 Tax=Acetobacter senegalensis TaxID=446692 RepID=UPI002654932B|nr:hypothetical protein [Acetobacter senegalensis]MDN7350776.1 hypothetical protein [Acetobacter senegalensis]
MARYVGQKIYACESRELLKKTMTPKPAFLTAAARRALRRHGRTSLSDLHFLEQWATSPDNNAASILRAGQIRRTNPDLMQDITTAMPGKTRRTTLR